MRYSVYSSHTTAGKSNYCSATGVSADIRAANTDWSLQQGVNYYKRCAPVTADASLNERRISRLAYMLPVTRSNSRMR